MTRPELHALVDIVMDARERMPNEDIWLDINTDIKVYHVCSKVFSLGCYPTFSDFTQAVKEYIKTLEG